MYEEVGEISDQATWSIAVRGRTPTHPTPRPALPFWQRTLLWATLAICLALVLGSASECWVQLGIERQVRTVQQRNTAIQQNITTTTNALKTAQSPDTIEREARAWGYARPGEQPIFVVAPRIPSK